MDLREPEITTANTGLTGSTGLTAEDESTSETFISILASAAILLSIGLWLIQILAIIFARYHFHSFKASKSQLNIRSAPGVTILKPLKFCQSSSGDLRTLRANLESFFQIKYPKFEVFFCVREADDSSVEIVRKLIQEYPKVKAELKIGGSDFGINPKINNMQKGYEKSDPSYEFIWICDAGIRARPETLTEMVLKIRENENVALVHQLPFVDGNGKKSAGNTLEKIYFGSQHGRIQISAHCFGQVCITGMSNLIRKSALEDACGGLRGLSNYIAEDYFMTVKMAKKGYEFRMSSFPALQNQTNTSVKGFFGRMLRWSKLRIKMLPGVTLIEPFTECFVSGILCTLALGWFKPGIPSFVFLSCYVIGWLATDYILLHSIQSEKSSKVPLHCFVCMWLLRELSTIFILIAALINPNLNWAQGTFRIRFGGIAEEVVKNPPRETSHSIS